MRLLKKNQSTCSCVAVVLATTLFLVSGCGTFITVTDHHGAIKEFGLVYGGVRCDFQLVFNDRYDEFTQGPFLKILFILDMPLSAIADTLLLPYTITKATELSKTVETR